jgi:hypothetical protein
MDVDTRRLLERGIEAIERLAEDPVIQIETGPPLCPFCERVNPVIRVGESENTGALAEFVIRAHCQHCNNVFYGIPLHWSTVKTTEEVREIISERVEAGGYSRNEHE